MKSNVTKFPTNPNNEIKEIYSSVYWQENENIDTYPDSKCNPYSAISLEEENDMDNKNVNDLMLKYIDNLDKKYDDYKRDMVESEKRIYQNIKDSEERYEKRQLGLDKKLDDNFKSIDIKLDKFEDKIDRKFENMQNEIKESNRYIKNLAITAMIGIGAMVVSIVGIFISVFVLK